MWAYASDMMTAGVSAARISGKVSYDRFRFPSYLSKMSRSKSIRALKSSMCYKIACALHTSTKRVETDILGPLKEMALNDPGIRAMLVKEVGLEPEELGFLLDSKIDSKMVKEAFQTAPGPKVPIAQNGPDDREMPLVRPVPDTTGKKPQSNLLDF
jgi:replication factor C large subunit